MTTPTQAQIEAAANAIKELWYGNADIGYENPAFNMMAKAALTAAAEVGEQPATIEYSATTIERCAQELEVAYAECNTLNLLHGAARIRALKDKP